MLGSSFLYATDSRFALVGAALTLACGTINRFDTYRKEDPQRIDHDKVILKERFDNAVSFFNDNLPREHQHDTLTVLRRAGAAYFNTPHGSGEPQTSARSFPETLAKEALANPVGLMFAAFYAAQGDPIVPAILGGIVFNNEASNSAMGQQIPKSGIMHALNDAATIVNEQSRKMFALMEALRAYSLSPDHEPRPTDLAGGP